MFKSNVNTLKAISFLAGTNTGYVGTSKKVGEVLVAAHIDAWAKDGVVCISMHYYPTDSVVPVDLLRMTVPFYSIHHILIEIEDYFGFGKFFLWEGE